MTPIHFLDGLADKPRALRTSALSGKRSLARQDRSKPIMSQSVLNKQRLRKEGEPIKARETKKARPRCGFLFHLDAFSSDTASAEDREIIVRIKLFIGGIMTDRLFTSEKDYFARLSFPTAPALQSDDPKRLDLSYSRICSGRY